MNMDIIVEGFYEGVFISSCKLLIWEIEVNV